MVIPFSVLADGACARGFVLILFQLRRLTAGGQRVLDRPWLLGGFLLIRDLSAFFLGPPFSSNPGGYLLPRFQEITLVSRPSFPGPLGLGWFGPFIPPLCTLVFWPISARNIWGALNGFSPPWRNLRFSVPFFPKWLTALVLTIPFLGNSSEAPKPGGKAGKRS